MGLHKEKAQYSNPSMTLVCTLQSLLPCSLPIKSLIGILKSPKIGGLLLLRDSKDPTVASIDPKIKSGKWNAKSAYSIVETELSFLKIRGPSQTGKSGVGVFKSPQILFKQTHGYRKVISSNS